MLISIVTPSYQQGRFIERTLESVARQDGDVEHIVMDGGSTDGTVEILERWRDRISFSSGRDGGQTAAINAGIARARGDVLAYLNSDDVYYDGAIAAAVEAFARDPSADVVYGDAVHIDAGDRIIGTYPTEEWSMERLKLVCFLCQPAVFFRRRVIERFGPFDARLHYCMDYEYWLRLGMRGARFVHLPSRLAASRVHAATKTRTRPRQVHTEINAMLRERIGRVPDNWLWNYAHAVLDARGVARSADRGYLLRAALLTAAAGVSMERISIDVAAPRDRIVVRARIVVRDAGNRDGCLIFSSVTSSSPARAQNISTPAKSTWPDGAMWKFFTLRLRIAVDAP